MLHHAWERRKVSMPCQQGELMEWPDKEDDCEN